MEKILLVEDEVEVANIITKFLLRAGFSVDVVYDLAQGMAKSPLDYTVVLLDIMLGGKKSFCLLEKVKKENPDIIVIMVSGHDTGEYITEAKRLGADGFLPKPFRMEYLEKFLLSKIKSLRRQADRE